MSHETGVGESERRITEKVAKYGGIYWWCLEDCDCDGAMPDPDAYEHKRKPDIYVKCSFARRVFTGLSLWQRRSRERTGVETIYTRRHMSLPTSCMAREDGQTAQVELELDARGGMLRAATLDNFWHFLSDFGLMGCTQNAAASVEFVGSSSPRAV